MVPNFFSNLFPMDLTLLC